MSTRPAHDLAGAWSIEVSFVDGPLTGTTEAHQFVFQPDGLYVQRNPHPGIGHWTLSGDQIIYTFHEVLTDAEAKPTTVVHVSARAVVSPDGESFDGSATGEVYALGAGLITTNRTNLRASRVHDA